MTTSCLATTAPAPSSKVPTTTTVRIIGKVSSSVRSPDRKAFPKDTTNSPARACGDDQFKRRRQCFIPPWRMSKAVPALVFTDRDPDPLGGRRHIDVIDLVFAPQSLDDRIDDRRTGPDRAGLARALDAQGIGLAGDVVGLEHK